MKHYGQRQQGLSLIVTMILLLALTILVLAATRTGTLGERISGNHMDRTRAYHAAEQALSQALALLTANGEACLEPCTSVTGGGVGPALTAAPATWGTTDPANAKVVTIATNQLSSAKFVINALEPAGSFLPPGKESCLPYSIMGRGVGLNADSVVVLQAISFVCPM